MQKRGLTFVSLGIVPFDQELTAFDFAQEWYPRDRPIGVSGNAFEQRVEVPQQPHDSPALEQW